MDVGVPQEALWIIRASDIGDQAVGRVPVLCTWPPGKAAAAGSGMHGPADGASHVAP